MSVNTQGSIPRPLDIKKIVKNFLSYKIQFIVLGVIALFVAYFINKLSMPQYSNSITFAVVDNSNSNFLSSNEFFNGGGIFGNNQAAENELAFISSYSLAYNTLMKMDVRISYYTKEQVFSFLPISKAKDIYKQNPYTVVMNEFYPQPANLPFQIIILNDKEFRLIAEGENIPLFNFIDNEVVGKSQVLIDKKFKFGEQVKTKYCDFQIVLNDQYDSTVNNQQELNFMFNDMKMLARYYQKSLTVSADFTLNTIVNVTMKGPNYQLIHDFLNEYTKTYLLENLDKKNNAAILTIDFIDNQISSVSDSLSRVEMQLQSFRSRNQVTDLSFQGEQLLERINNLETEKATISMHIKYYTYIEEYFNKQTDVSDLVAPSGMGVDDVVLNNLIEQILQLNAERIRLLDDGNTKNLYLRNIEIQINNLKNTVMENIRNNLKTTSITLDDLNQRLSKLTAELRRLPGTERELFGIERQFRLNDAIYNFLLERRAEAQISKASNMADVEVIDPARIINPEPISPKKKLNYAIGLLISIFLNVGYVLLKDFFNTKIRTRDDIRNLGNFSVLGYVNHETNENIKKQLSNNTGSILAESFRAVRTNMQFFASNHNIQTIVITSSVSGEGKTFIVKNLADVLTMNDFRVAVVDFDLRKPSLHKQFKQTNELGVTSYLINAATIDDICSQTNNPKLDLYPAGPIAPNPSELISSNNTTNFLELLKEQYDYVIIDTSPVGLLSETFLLMQKADLNIFAVRLNYSVVDIVTNTLQQINEKDLSDISLIINDVDSKTTMNKYKYGKNYYTK